MNTCDNCGKVGDTDVLYIASEEHNLCEVCYPTFHYRKVDNKYLMGGDKKVKRVAQEAMMAFWDVVAKSYPEIKSGDIEPLVSLEMETKSEEWVEHWVEGNS